MILKNIPFSSQAKDQLARLKGKTGIDQWNILCRWALCLSLSEPPPPTSTLIPQDSNLVIEWHTLLGEHHELYEALVIERAIQDGIKLEQGSLGRYFRQHLHRGIAHLAGPSVIRNTADLLTLVLEGSKPLEGALSDASIPRL